ncbi:universal stress protein [Aliifodinibius sp. S!AR15-10]|uniref:universal stress protein n=1 Tax=Aliifodinibius sp. S!AR15-10 TaxID=2950437 RepID=UPI00285BB909|nr:universal stress protein [Aliifodinibius sp. S!AR15-10]MDR8393272.1 universal stress protein [Aliifodinibius sp. S!AR15-10]
MIKRILIALDPDVDTQVATIYGIQLARNFDATVTGLAVVDTEQVAAEVSGGSVGIMYYPEHLQKMVSENTRKEAGKLLAAFEETVSTAGVKHSEVMEEGVPYERIIEDMKYHDLLIIGRDTHFFYSQPEKKTNTLSKIVKKGTVPSLVVMESYRDIERALVAFDGERSVARTLQWFVQLQPYGNELEMELVHVNSGSSERSRDESNLVLRLAEDYLRGHGFKNVTKTVLEGDTPGENLLAHQKKISADLLILGAHSMSALRRIAFGSTTHYLLTRSKVPLFMCH